MIQISEWTMRKHVTSGPVSTANKAAYLIQNISGLVDQQIPLLFCRLESY